MLTLHPKRRFLTFQYLLASPYHLTMARIEPGQSYTIVFPLLREIHIKKKNVWRTPSHYIILAGLNANLFGLLPRKVLTLKGDGDTLN